VCARACSAIDEIIKAHTQAGSAGCVMGRPSHFLDGHVQQCNIEFTTQLLFVWQRASRQSEFRPSVPWRCEHTESNYCIVREMMDGKEALSSAKHTQLEPRERETPADATFMLLGGVSVLLSPRRPPPTWPPYVRLFCLPPRERNGTVAFDEIQIPGIHSTNRFSDATLSSSKKSIVRRLQMILKGCFFLIGNRKLHVLLLLVIGSCFSSENFSISKLEFRLCSTMFNLALYCV
jgi:hypothetical protein